MGALLGGAGGVGAEPRTEQCRDRCEGPVESAEGAAGWGALL